MAAKPAFVLLANALPPDAVPLGTLIPVISQPHQDGLPSPPHLTPGIEYLKLPQTDFAALAHSARSSSAWLHLSRLLHLSADSAAGSSHQLAARKAWRYDLRHPRRLFVALCARPDVREYVREEVEAGAQELFFVTGYCTFVDANVTQDAGALASAAAHVDLPLGEALLGPAGAALGGLADVGAGAGYAAEHEQARHFTTPGERIYALSYRRVKFQWFARGDIDKAELERTNRWIMTPDTKADNEEDAEVVQADLDEFDEDAEGLERLEMPDGALHFFYKKE